MEIQVVKNLKGGLVPKSWHTCPDIRNWLNTIKSHLVDQNPIDDPEIDNWNICLTVMMQARIEMSINPIFIKDLQNYNKPLENWYTCRIVCLIDGLYKCIMKDEEYPDWEYKLSRLIQKNRKMYHTTI